MEIEADRKHCIAAFGPTKFSHLVRFRSTHGQFRLPELESLASLFNERVKYNYEQVPLVSSDEILIQVGFQF